MLNVLFLCTGNSARSILGEAIMTKMGAGRFRGYSAGSHPMGAPNPLALNVLTANGHDIAGLHSKSWDVFAAPDAPEMHMIFTVCDQAAGETCPFWPGHPTSAHWGLPDPVTAADFARTYDALTARITAMLNLPLHDTPSDDLRQALNKIGLMSISSTGSSTGPNADTE